ncbi:MAG: hypothetical protein IKW00_03205 [Clostridia bacterium]|nr:hypothetical protein [Clostridia bacterium]
MKHLFDMPQTAEHPRFVSHRGFQPLAPANSLPSFEYAGRLGQWAIETDVHMTRDGHLVCCHNTTVDATFNGTGAIKEMTLKECRALRMNVGNRLECLRDDQKVMPLFSEYLAICKKFGSIPFLELKTEDSEAVMRAVEESGIGQEGVVCSSGQYDYLVLARKAAPRAFMHLIFAKEEQVEDMARMGNAGLSWRIDDPLARPVEKIRLAHDNGLKVCLRAGDTVESVRIMLELGLDYIPSNCMHGAL